MTKSEGNPKSEGRKGRVVLRGMRPSSDFAFRAFFGFRHSAFGLLAAALLLLLASRPIASLASETASKAHGLESRPSAKAYLLMPEREDGALPQLLSQTGAFADTRNLVPSSSLVAYDLNVPFWSDGATKSRWVAVPNDRARSPKIHFNATGEWIFPKGTVFVKHFELGTDELRPAVKRRLETRLLVCDSAGGVYGATYKWRADGSDAELLATNLTEPVVIETAAGARTQMWYYPSRQDCRVCHTANAGMVLGVKTRQLNRDFAYPSGVTDNELRTWDHLGLFDSKLGEAGGRGLAKLARADDTTRSLEDRARSYLDANCAHCHRPGGTVAYFDARYDTALPQQNLVDGQVLFDMGVDGARPIAPNDVWRSLVLTRLDSVDALKMPQLAHSVADREGVALIRQWIESLPGPPVLPPPTFSPPGGDYAKPVTLALNDTQPGVTIRYTLDGSKPTTADAAYVKPIRLGGPTTVRAKAFKNGFTKSITVQETFIIGE